MKLELKAANILQNILVQLIFDHNIKKIFKSHNEMLAEKK